MKINELTPEEESMLEQNIVWIFASRRSGTTWLGKELLSYDTKYMDEPLVGHHLGRLEQTKTGFVRTIDQQEKRSDYFYSKKYEKIWKYYLRKLILNRVYSQFQDLSHKIIIKEPTGSFASDILANCLPASRIIVIIRDGRDVLDSVLDALQKGGWETNRGHIEMTKKMKMQFITRHSKQWVKLMEVLMKTYDSHPSNKRILIRYEDLRKNTIDVLKKIYQFLEIDISQEKIESLEEKFRFENIPESEKGFGKFKRIARPGNWRDSFNDEEKKIFENLMKDTLRQNGY